MTNEVLKAIHERRSCRWYKDEQINDEELQTVLEAGTWAPTGMGLQYPQIVAVQNPGLKERITKLNALVMDSKGDPFYGAPTIILVFAPESWKNSIQDGSLVMSTMMLAAHSIGLASCWINREIEMFQTNEGKAIRKALGVGDEMGGVAALALGYPASKPVTPKPRKLDYFKIVK